MSKSSITRNYRRCELRGIIADVDPDFLPFFDSFPEPSRYSFEISNGADLSCEWSSVIKVLVAAVTRMHPEIVTSLDGTNPSAQSLAIFHRYGDIGKNLSDIIRDTYEMVQLFVSNAVAHVHFTAAEVCDGVIKYGDLPPIQLDPSIKPMSFFVTMTNYTNNSEMQMKRMEASKVLRMTGERILDRYYDMIVKVLTSYGYALTERK